MRQLSIVKSDAPASRWLLEKEFLGKDWPALDDAQRDEFGRILEVLYKDKPDDVPIQQLYADYLIAVGEVSPGDPSLDGVDSSSTDEGTSSSRHLP